MSEPTSEPPEQPASEQSVFEQPSSVPPPPPAGYPAPPKAAPSLAPTGVGVVLALGGVLAVVAGFLQYVKITYPGGSYAFTGLGAETITGPGTADQFTPGNPGKTIFAVGVVAVVLGLLIVARQGKLWVGIVAVFAGAIGSALGVVALLEPGRDADTIQRQIRAIGPEAANVEVTGSIGIGAILGTVGAVVTLVAGIVAISKRTSQPAPSDPDANLPTGPEPGDELAS